VDWIGWLTFGFVATAVLTAVLVGAQLAGLTRMDIPALLGTIFVADLDRARVLGLFMHMGVGQFFALFYASGFHLLNRATWWLGASFGLVHGVAALTLIVPALPGVHPRMASTRSGPDLHPLEPPGLLALHYGTQTIWVTLMAHAVYGAILGATLHP
jgi:hypothetical protein